MGITILTRPDLASDPQSQAARTRGAAVWTGILESLDEILTVTRLAVPTILRRALACTNIVDVMHTVRRVCRNGEATAISLDGAALNLGSDAGSNERLSDA
jgi:hypothetical protein